MLRFFGIWILCKHVQITSPQNQGEKEFTGFIKDGNCVDFGGINLRHDQHTTDHHVNKTHAEQETWNPITYVKNELISVFYIENRMKT